MWVNSGELIIVPLTIEESGYKLIISENVDDGWSIRDKSGEIVFTANLFWEDIPRIKEWMPLTFEALMANERTKEIYLSTSEFRKGLMDTETKSRK